MARQHFSAITSSSSSSQPASAISARKFGHRLINASSWHLTVFKNKYISSDRVKLRGERGEWIPIIGKAFKKVQPPKIVNRPSDRKLKNNGTSKSKVYRKKQPFSSYGPKRGFQKGPKSWITPEKKKLGH